MSVGWPSSATTVSPSISVRRRVPLIAANTAPDTSGVEPELESLLAHLPAQIGDAVRAEARERGDIVEIILDLGRHPEVRYGTGQPRWKALDLPVVTRPDLESITGQLRFASNHRAAMPGTLHRISGLYDLNNEVVGLTCRVGRVIEGAAEFLRSVISDDRSVLLLGRPGVGKTTLLRDIARILAEERIVVVVDKSMEIGGDDAVPMGVGHARRIMVKDPTQQQPTMIEAVQNHNPQVIIVDEIGTLDEVKAARTIAENGVKLVATAHGATLEDLIRNPTLNDLIGGTHEVTVGDDTARRFAGGSGALNKTKEERKQAPTFDLVIEIQDRNTLTIYDPLATAVDEYLFNKVMPEGKRIVRVGPIVAAQPPATPVPGAEEEAIRPLRVILDQVGRGKVVETLRAMGIGRGRIELVDDIEMADVVLTDSRRERRGSPLVDAARAAGKEVVGVTPGSEPSLRARLGQLAKRGYEGPGAGERTVA